MKKLLFLAFMACASQQALAEAQSDPYAAIRYSAAFDQDTLYQKHANLMKKSGCALNVFPAKKSGDLMAQSHELTQVGQGVDLLDTQLPQVTPEEEIAAYEKACLNQLRHARYIALSQPGINAAMEMVFFGGVSLAVFLVLKYIEKDKSEKDKQPSLAG